MAIAAIVPHYLLGIAGGAALLGIFMPVAGVPCLLPWRQSMLALVPLQPHRTRTGPAGQPDLWSPNICLVTALHNYTQFAAMCMEMARHQGAASSDRAFGTRPRIFP